MMIRPASASFSSQRAAKYRLIWRMCFSVSADKRDAFRFEDSLGHCSGLSKDANRSVVLFGCS
jgi:hypothetical protein